MKSARTIESGYSKSVSLLGFRGLAYFTAYCVCTNFGVVTASGAVQIRMQQSPACNRIRRCLLWGNVQQTCYLNSCLLAHMDHITDHGSGPRTSTFDKVMLRTVLADVPDFA
jgi:hypothetical protein